VKRERVLQVFEVEDKDYQATCAAMGLSPPPPELDIAQMELFERIQEHKKSGKIQNYKEASILVKQWQEEASSNFDAILHDLVKDPAQITADRIKSLFIDIDGKLNERVAWAFLKVVRDKLTTPEVQRSISEALEGNAVDVDSLLVGKSPVALLAPSRS
jgi:hypothetical protein